MTHSGRHVIARTPSVLATSPAAPGSSNRPETVDVVIPVKNPDMQWLDLTLGSLERQSHTPRVTIVDCFQPAVSVDTALDVQVLSAPCSIPGQRRTGIAATTGDVVVHLDEDAVLTRPDHIASVLEQLDDLDVAGVGGVVAPIRGNRLGRIAGALSPTRAWFPAHRRSLCPDGQGCFPTARTGTYHNDDRMLKKRLNQSGRVVEDSRLVVLTDLPTRKQRTAMGLLGGVAAVAAAGGVP